MAAAVVAPFLTYGWGRLQGEIQERAAIKRTRAEEVHKCNARVISIEDEARRSADDRVSRATAAEAPAPTTLPELEALCLKSPSCREKGKKK